MNDIAFNILWILIFFLLTLDFAYLPSFSIKQLMYNILFMLNIIKQCQLSITFAIVNNLLSVI